MNEEEEEGRRGGSGFEGKSNTPNTKEVGKFAGPSAQRRVGILSGWSNGQRVLLSIDPGDPWRPETWRCRILDGTFSTL